MDHVDGARSRSRLDAPFQRRIGVGKCRPIRRRPRRRGSRRSPRGTPHRRRNVRAQPRLERNRDAAEDEADGPRRGDEGRSPCRPARVRSAEPVALRNRFGEGEILGRRHLDVRRFALDDPHRMSRPLRRARPRRSHRLSIASASRSTSRPKGLRRLRKKDLLRRSSVAVTTPLGRPVDRVARLTAPRAPRRDSAAAAMSRNQIGGRERPRGIVDDDDVGARSRRRGTQRRPNPDGVCHRDDRGGFDVLQAGTAAAGWRAPRQRHDDVVDVRSGEERNAALEDRAVRQSPAAALGMWRPRRRPRPPAAKIAETNIVSKLYGHFARLRVAARAEEDAERPRLPSAIAAADLRVQRSRNGLHVDDITTWRALRRNQTATMQPLTMMTGRKPALIAVDAFVEARVGRRWSFTSVREQEGVERRQLASAPMWALAAESSARSRRRTKPCSPSTVTGSMARLEPLEERPRQRSSAGRTTS